jgi:epoxyqueuosine reductase
VTEGDLADWAASVVVVAAPSQAFRVSFDLGDRLVETILPPTYRRYRVTFEEVRQDLWANGLAGARVEHLTGPLKAIAARLGLVRYGRNNLAYADGMGSYLQLCGFVTDVRLPAADYAARSPMLLPECEDCEVCRLACPTGAIDATRVLLHAERCLTFANENPGEWPEWVPARAHHCLLGCLACQRGCPANPKLATSNSGVAFSAEETRALLDEGTPADRKHEDGIRKKLAWLGQPYAEPVLGRNLCALLDR